MKRLLFFWLVTVLAKSTFAFFPSYDLVVIEKDTLFTYSDLFKSYAGNDSLYQNVENQIQDFRKKENPQGYLTGEYEEIPLYSVWEIVDNRVYLTNIKKYAGKWYDIDL